MRAVLRASRASARSSRQAPRDRRSRSLVVLALAAVVVAGGARGTQDAAANGDTRTLSIVHEHTKESLTVTFKRDGRYDRAVLEQLNWLLRDWRIDEPTKMDPRLFDVVWEAHRATGSRDAIHVVSAYRSPQTNAALRRRSRAVAEHSQHMLGKAMDFYLGDVSVDQIRQIGMQMQRGGVGWYPHAYNPFVHLDVGSVRSWPRMPGDQLARLFPDGRTVHLPADGRPLPGYDSAKAEILSRGGTVMGITQVAAAEEEDSPNFVRQLFSALFGGGAQQAPAPAPTAVAARGRPSRPRPVALASADPDDAGSRAALAYAADPRAALVPEAAPAAAPPPEPTTTGARAEPVDAVPEAPAPAVAGSAVAGLKAPLPPRRPSEFAALANALVAAPLPQGRSGPATQVASADPTALLPARPRAAAASPAPAPSSTDPKAHLRALFAAAVAQTASASPARLAQTRATPQGAPPKGLVATPAGEVATRFQATAGDEAETGRFSGAAVKAPPVLRR